MEIYAIDPNACEAANLGRSRLSSRSKPAEGKLQAENRLLKNTGNRLLTRAAQNRAQAFAITYRAAIGGSGPTQPFFSTL